MPSFDILIHDNISIAELLTIRNNGGVVLKTPHVGNIYPNNLAFALMGVPMLFYDRTIGIKDFNFHPSKYIINGESVAIARSDILTTHAKINQCIEIGSKIMEVGTELVDFHMIAFNQALPQTNSFTYTEYIKENKEKIIQILKKITETRAYLWDRIVDSEGNISRLTANNWTDIIKIGIFGLHDVKCGWIIPNIINILFHGTVDILKSHTKDVYLLSGPDMYQYISEYQYELNDIYTDLKESIYKSLPNTMYCHIVPVMDMRFIVEVEYRESLNYLVDMYLKYSFLEDAIRILIKNEGCNADINDFVIEKKKIKDSIIKCIENNFRSFERTMFYDIRESSCFTQYDLIKSNGLYIHPWAIKSKLKDVSKAFKLLQKYYFLVKNQY